jgi:hypothetical protein
MAYVLHFTSADHPGPDSTWSVYREEYVNVYDDEPIEGSTVWISSHMNEAVADHEARRLQREANQ